VAVLRFLASLFLLAAVLAFAADSTQMLSGTGPFKSTSFAQHWQDLAPTTLARARDALSTGQASFLWPYLVEPLIALPSFLLFGLLAALTGYIGRRRRRVEIFVN
jgi:hypothetical protein